MSLVDDPPQPFEADLVAYDPSARPVLIVEAKGYPIEHPMETLRYLTSLVQANDFWLLADPSRLRLYRSDPDGHAFEPLAELETAIILGEYDPTLADRRPSADHLIALVDAWLRDLALRWRPATPPGMEALQGTDLLERLAGGSTERGAVLHGDRLR